MSTMRIDASELIERRTIEYKMGDATRPEGPGRKIIAHVVNDEGRWGKGFVMAISKRWPDPERAYKEWYQQAESNDFRLGALQMVRVEGSTWVANLVAQHGMEATEAGPPIRYAALELALSALCQRALQLDASVHMPRLGCGLAGGSWEEVGPRVQEALCDKGVPVFVYDFK